MADWDPALYRRYEDERTRPARDLLARVPHAAPRRVVDLGCGPGNSTELLVARWPKAEITGLDNSESMLKSAREQLGGVARAAAEVRHAARGGVRHAPEQVARGAGALVLVAPVERGIPGGHARRRLRRAAVRAGA